MPDMRNLQLSGYTLHTNLLESDDVRGTCIYVNNKFKSSILKLDHHEFADSVSVEITGQNYSKILVTCIYRSGTPQKAITKDEKMYKLMRSSTAVSGYKMKIIVGDFNLNKINWCPDPELPTAISDDSPEYKRSDHVTITCNLNTNLKPSTIKQVTYNYNKTDYIKMKTMLDKDWNSLLENKCSRNIRHHRGIL